MVPAAPASASHADQEADLGQSFWQQVAALGALDEQQRLAALRQHLHLKPAELEP
jgi:hypothetical protein